MAKILVVDDDKAIRQFVSHCLTMDNHEVIEAPNGRQALKMARKNWLQLRLIILDIVMNGMDGIEVLRKIKKNPKTCAIPVIMLTGFDYDHYRADSMHNYASEFLVKPITSEQLSETVSKIIGTDKYHITRTETGEVNEY